MGDLRPTFLTKERSGFNVEEVTKEKTCFAVRLRIFELSLMAAIDGNASTTPTRRFVNPFKKSF